MKTAEEILQDKTDVSDGICSTYIGNVLEAMEEYASQFKSEQQESEIPFYFEHGKAALVELLNRFGRKNVEAWIDEQKIVAPECKEKECACRSYDYCRMSKQVARIIPEQKEETQDELIMQLLMFTESDGTVVNGFRTQEIIQKLRSKIKT